MTKFSKWVALLCSLGLIAVIFLPLWRIELTAPQYPEGLLLQIYSHKLGGNVEVVNGLNHYIGMRTLHEKDFPEFAVLPYIIATLVFFGLLSLMLRRRWFFLTWVAFYMIFAVTAMIDFYRWEYNYGHNLDPTAPIQVPDMTYQPPLIGYKQLLNFGVYSIPDTGGWIFIGVAVFMLVAVYSEWRGWKKSPLPVSASVVVTLVGLTLFVSGCRQGPVPIRYGQDACDFCRMTITDNRYGGELITNKGKLYKFDDIHCLRSFMDSSVVEEKDIGQIFLVDFTGMGWIKAGESFLLQSDSLHSPMGSNTAAFKNPDSLSRIKKEVSGKELRWNEIMPS